MRTLRYSLPAALFAVVVFPGESKAGLPVVDPGANAQLAVQIGKVTRTVDEMTRQLHQLAQMRELMERNARPGEFLQQASLIAGTGLRSLEEFDAFYAGLQSLQQVFALYDRVDAWRQHPCYTATCTVQQFNELLRLMENLTSRVQRAYVETRDVVEQQRTSVGQDSQRLQALQDVVETSRTSRLAAMNAANQVAVERNRQLLALRLLLLSNENGAVAEAQKTLQQGHAARAAWERFLGVGR